MNSHNSLPPDINSYNFSNKNKKSLVTLAEDFVKSLFENGVLTDKDLTLSKKELIDKARLLFDRIDLLFIIDHRDRVLREATILYNKGEYEMAKIMYAMFFEHSINNIISNCCFKKRFDEKTKIDIIRSVDIHGKLTWLLKIFNLPTFNNSYRIIIKMVAEDRNAFIHYKWKSEKENKSRDDLTQINDEFKKIKSAVKYMKTYESKVIYGNNKKKIEQRLKTK